MKPLARSMFHMNNSFSVGTPGIAGNRPGACLPVRRAGRRNRATQNALRLSAVLLLACIAGVAHAASYSWTFTSNAAAAVAAEGYAGQVNEFSAMTFVNGFGMSVALGSFADTDNDSKIESAYLTYQGPVGLGVTSRDGVANDEVTAAGTTVHPQRSVDNDGATESILFDFGSAFNLSAIDIGWSMTDSDLTVYAYTGTEPFSAGTLVGQTYSTLTGWSNVGDYTGTTEPRATTNTTYSRYWLVTPGSSTDNKDYVKIAGITGSYGATPQLSATVPEPASLTLMVGALAGLMYVRRRR